MENEANDSFATLATELTLKRSDLQFLSAAFQHVGWDVDPRVEGITTDEGYDHEVRMRLRVRVPIEVAESAPEVALDDELEHLIDDMALVA